MRTWACTWACGHARRGNNWSQYDAPFGYPLEYWAERAASATARYDIAEEIKQRRQRCPACAEQQRRARNHWTALAVVAALLLLVAWRCV